MTETFKITDYIEQTTVFEKIKAFLRQKKSFAVNCISTSAKVLLSSAFSQYSKIVLVVDSEQTAIKYKNDLKVLANIDAMVFPYQESGLYDANIPNIYKYAEQISVLQNIYSEKPEKIIILPLKAAFEKFPQKDFFEENSLELKTDEEADTKQLAQKLIKMGYKKVVTVSDIGEFSIRGDTADIYSLSQNPVRIELWGDTITDLRFFDADTQRSIEKIQSVKILPVSKFMREDNLADLFQNSAQKALKTFLKNSTEDEKIFFKQKYEQILSNFKTELDFEGIEYFENILNPYLKTFLELIPADYTVVFDEYNELKSKYQQIDNNLQKKYNENLKLPSTLPLENFTHAIYEEFIQSFSSKNKIYFDNLLTEEFAKIVDLSTETAPLFSADLNKTVEFIEERRKQGYKIVIATDFKSRVTEILREFEIPVSDNFDEKNDVCLFNNTALAAVYAILSN